ncbi:MAG: hypothetical protein Q8L23_00015 [Caulobacter sp.]|nr:hypothetical protein [Caulobacter sp.]
MTLTQLLTAAAVSALLAGPALAGPDPAHQSHQPQPDVASPLPTPADAPAASDAASPASATTVDPTAPAVIPLDSPTPPEQAYALTPVSPSVTTNGPVPDTAENRALYGGPMSNGGRRTRPVGN